MHALAVVAPTEVGSIWAALAEIPDPEIPTISIVDLGIVHRAELGSDGTIRVQLLPTFFGGPAIELIPTRVHSPPTGSTSTTSNPARSSR